MNLFQVIRLGLFRCAQRSRRQLITNAGPRAFLIIVLASACFQNIHAESDESASFERKKPFTLQGGVEHSEKMPPVEKEFRHGAKIDSNKLAPLNQLNRWYRIPDWAAGTWTSVQSTKTYIHDLKSGREQTSPVTRNTKMEFTWGFQQDRDGHIWEFAKEPYSLTVDSADFRVIKRVKERDFLESNDSKVVLKTVTENVVVDKFNNQVVRTVQSETIQVCEPTANQCMTCAASYKLFDEQGKPTELGKETNVSRRISTFKGIDEYEGKNMLTLFKEYMKSQGKADLAN